jgi:hypothetical protein
MEEIKETRAEPPICADAGLMVIAALKIQIWAFGARLAQPGLPGVEDVFIPEVAVHQLPRQPRREAKAGIIPDPRCRISGKGGLELTAARACHATCGRPPRGFHPDHLHRRW